MAPDPGRCINRSDVDSECFVIGRKSWHIFFIIPIFAFCIVYPKIQEDFFGHIYILSWGKSPYVLFWLLWLHLSGNFEKGLGTENKSNPVLISQILTPNVAQLLLWKMITFFYLWYIQMKGSLIKWNKSTTLHISNLGKSNFQCIINSSWAEEKSSCEWESTFSESSNTFQSQTNSF